MYSWKNKKLINAGDEHGKFDEIQSVKIVSATLEEGSNEILENLKEITLNVSECSEEDHTKSNNSSIITTVLPLKCDENKKNYTRDPNQKVPE